MAVKIINESEDEKTIEESIAGLIQKGICFLDEDKELQLTKSKGQEVKAFISNLSFDTLLDKENLKNQLSKYCFIK